MAKILVKSLNDKKRIGSDRPTGPYASACGICGEDGHEGLHQGPRGKGYGCRGHDKPDTAGLWTPPYSKNR